VPLPTSGRPADDIFSELDDRATHDVRWRDGRAFTLAYSAGPEALAVADEAYRRFSSANALNTDAFPSLRAMQNEVVANVSHWLDAPDSAAGFMTSGGTESILLAVKAARERGRTESSIDRPNMVLPTSAHAAFDKAGKYFGVEVRRVAVRDDWRADPEAMRQRIDDDTVLVVASAPQYPQGVVDPVPEIAAAALERSVNCHVDACMGGVTLAYLGRLGVSVAPWNFAVPGVTSMSVDLHKYGYTAKGASVLMHRDRTLRNYQTFVTDGWLGGLYGSSGILGTKSGGPIAAAWATMQFLGDAGYLELTRSARSTCLRIVDTVERHERLTLRAFPDATLFAFGSADDELDVYGLADELWRRGWYLDRQAPPASLHCTVNAVHEQVCDAFLGTLSEAIDTVTASSTTGTAGAYGTVD
jgi:sphinganine-1-phosphate aldolase